MATDASDPQHLKSWKEAFQYPIPMVRRLEQELRRDIGSNKDKLRALVGTRYRDLLGTAETIVEMNVQVQEVEANLSEMGRKCNTRLIEKKSAHVNRLRHDALQNHARDRTLAAQLTLLHRCTSAVSRLLRVHDSVLLVAKLLVISRLLHKALSQNKDAPPFLGSLRNQLASLRRTLLKRIDRCLASANSTAGEITESMSAFCLSTSSSSADVIRHFHQVRLDMVQKHLKRADSLGENFLQALKLYILTLQNAMVIFSSSLSGVLGTLTDRPLLTNDDVRKLGDLDVDILERWVTSEIKNFTPWIKSGGVPKAEAEQAIKTWSKQAFESSIEGWRSCLRNYNNFSDVISLRKRALDMWLSSGVSTLAHSFFGVLEGIRNAFNGQLSTILQSQAQELELIRRDVSNVIANWSDHTDFHARSLWQPDLTSMDYSSGAVSFKQAIVNTVLGRSPGVSAIMKTYHSWLKTIQESRALIDDLRRLKWGDSFDEEDEDMEVNPKSLLNEDDPYFLQQEQKSTVSQAIVDLQSSFHNISNSLQMSNQSDKATFMLRLIRDLRGAMPVNILGFVDFANEIVPSLQKVLVAEVVAGIASSTIFKGPKTTNQKPPGRTLWEGEPELPLQPLPSTFQFLRQLAESMENIGPDLWNPSTLKVLKKSLMEDISVSFLSNYEELDSFDRLNDRPINANSTAAMAVEDKHDGDYLSEQDDIPCFKLHDWRIQLLFDAIYLRDALFTGSDGDDGLGSVIERLQSDMNPETNIIIRLEKAAHGYWKRTELLFGLLMI